MLFNSWQFGIFFPAVFLLYWSLPQRFRVYLLLVSSYYFYMSWNVRYVALILFTTLISYTAALSLERYHQRRIRHFILTITLCACLSVLFVFKYFNFFAGTFADFMAMFSIRLHPVTLRLLLPVGISFYTFQTLSYVIDVYRGEVKAERNLIYYATFISFFPQLVAGPIERTSNLLPQIKAHHEFNYEQAVYGLKLMVWGLFKKLAVADVIAMYPDIVFGNVHNYQGFALVLAVFFFTVQIYCDFSGYSDIARGCSKMLGIDLMENFRSPYFSAGIREFWSRWHISLSTWFRDYVYIPLGGSRVGRFRHYFNLMVTFMISGLWHGADWTFVAWGGVHGLGQVLEDLLGHGRHEVKGLRRAGCVLVTFMFCSLAWVFFRAESLGEAGYVFAHVFEGISDIRDYIAGGFQALAIGKNTAIKIAVLYFVPLMVIDLLALKYDVFALTGRLNDTMQYACVMMAGLVILAFGYAGQSSFVYFQF